MKAITHQGNRIRVISREEAQSLREQTGNQYPLMLCKKALNRFPNNVDRAINWLQTEAFKNMLVNEKSV